MGFSRPPTAGLAEKLFQIRTSLGLSQAQMVGRLKSQRLPSPLRIYAGNISRFEQGMREPPLLVLLAYARAAGVAVEVLIDAELELPDKSATNSHTDSRRSDTGRVVDKPVSVRRMVARKAKT